MSVASGRRRGAEAQNWLADFYRGSGWMHAESVGSGRWGADITGMPGLSPEVKASHEFRLESWLKQAEGRPGIPYVIYRGNGLGVASLRSWPVIMRLAEHTQLLRDAGYGGDA